MWTMGTNYDAWLSPNDLGKLNKALTAGTEMNPPASAVPGDGFALRTESLESVLRNTTYRAEHIKLWKLLTKSPAHNIFEEYNQITSYGEGDFGAWIAEGDLPEESDATYIRKHVMIKFMATVRRVTHPMSLVRAAHGDVIANETIAGTMFLLKQLERALFTADSDLDPLQFDGVDKLIASQAPAYNIIDMRGEPLSEDVLTDAALTISASPNFGRATHLFLNPMVRNDLAKTFFPKARYDLLGLKSGKVGLHVEGYTSSGGDVLMIDDDFIETTPPVPTSAQGNVNKRPGAPTISTAPNAAAPGAGQTSLFGVDDAGTYIYSVVARSRYGTSTAVAAAAVTVAAGEVVTLGMTPAAGTETTHFAVYRSLLGQPASTGQLIGRIPAMQTGPSAFVDSNETLPGTSSAYLFQGDSTNLGFKQLAPMTRIPLATADTSIRWQQVLYGAPVVYSPGRNVIFRNVGRADNFVGTP